MNNKGYSAIELILTIVVFSVIYFVAANYISYNFDVNYEEDLYNLTISSIEKQAAIYGEIHQELFTEEPEVYLTVGELALENAVVSAEGGIVADPRDSEKDLNDLKVKIVNNEGDITAKVLVS